MKNMQYSTLRARREQVMSNESTRKRLSLQTVESVSMAWRTFLPGSKRNNEIRMS